MDATACVVRGRYGVYVVLRFEDGSGELDVQLDADGTWWIDPRRVTDQEKRAAFEQFARERGERGGVTVVPRHVDEVHGVAV